MSTAIDKPEPIIYQVTDEQLERRLYRIAAQTFTQTEFERQKSCRINSLALAMKAVGEVSMSIDSCESRQAIALLTRLETQLEILLGTTFTLPTL